MKNCKHKYQTLDVEKSKTPSRYTTTYYRTTRLFCEHCTDIKEINETKTIGIYENDRPSWTKNI